MCGVTSWHSTSPARLVSVESRGELNMHSHTYGHPIYRQGDCLQKKKMKLDTVLQHNTQNVQDTIENHLLDQEQRNSQSELEKAIKRCQYQDDTDIGIS